MENSKNIERIYDFSAWILIPVLGFCYLLFFKIRVLDFSSPYLNDWIFIEIMVCLFWTSITIAILLMISLYYRIRAIVFESTGRHIIDEINKNIEYSKKIFIYAFEFLNLMIIVSAILMLFWIVLYCVAFFVDPFTTDKNTSVTISSLVSIFIIWFIIKKINKTKIGSFFKNKYSDCIFLTKKFKNICMLYLAILSLVFPLSCYRFELQLNKEIFTKGQDSVIIIDITLGGMTSSSNYYNKLRTYLIGDNLEKEIMLNFTKVDKMKFRSIMEIINLPRGNYRIVSFYRRRFIFFWWDISRERLFQII